MIDFIGPTGDAITLEEWEDLFQRRTETMAAESWWRKYTCVNGVIVSTVWLGLPITDDGLGAWETMITGDCDLDGERKYRTRQEALDDHERIVRELRALHREETTR